jgi:hypothetical protein
MCIFELLKQGGLNRNVKTIPVHEPFGPYCTEETKEENLSVEYRVQK